MDQINIELAYRRARDAFLYSSLLGDLQASTNIWSSSHEPGLYSISDSLNSLIYVFTRVCSYSGTSLSIERELSTSSSQESSQSPSPQKSPSRGSTTAASAVVTSMVGEYPERNISENKKQERQGENKVEKSICNKVSNDGDGLKRGEPRTISSADSEGSVMTRLQTFFSVVSQLQQVVSRSCSTKFSKNKKALLINELEHCRLLVSNVHEAAYSSSGKNIQLPSEVDNAYSRITPSKSRDSLNSQTSLTPHTVAPPSTSLSSNQPQPVPSIAFDKIFDNFISEANLFDSSSGKLLNSLYENGKIHGNRLFSSVDPKNLNNGSSLLKPKTQTTMAARDIGSKNSVYKTFKGVSIINDKISAYIEYRGKQVVLGVFHSCEAAARAHDRGLIRTIGPINCREYNLNFPLVDYARDHISLFSEYDIVLKKYLFGTGWSGPKGCDFSFLITQGILSKSAASSSSSSSSDNNYSKSHAYSHPNHNLNSELQSTREKRKVTSSLYQNESKSKGGVASSDQVSQVINGPRRVSIRPPVNAGDEISLALGDKKEIFGTFLYSKLAGKHQVRLVDNTVISIRGVFVSSYNQLYSDTYQLKILNDDDFENNRKKAASNSSNVKISNSAQRFNRNTTTIDDLRINDQVMLTEDNSQVGVVVDLKFNSWVSVNFGGQERNIRAYQLEVLSHVDGSEVKKGSQISTDDDEKGDDNDDEYTDDNDDGNYAGGGGFNNNHRNSIIEDESGDTSDSEQDLGNNCGNYINKQCKVAKVATKKFAPKVKAPGPPRSSHVIAKFYVEQYVAVHGLNIDLSDAKGIQNGQIGIVTRECQHPSTWYTVKMGDGSEPKFRSPNLRAVTGNIERVQCSICSTQSFVQSNWITGKGAKWVCSMNPDLDPGTMCHA